MTSSSPSTLDLSTFAEKLLADRGVQGIDPEVLNEMKEDLQQRVEERVNLTLVRAMPPEKMEEFERLVNSGDMEQIAAFCTQNIPNLEQVIASELLNFRTSYLTTG